MKNIPIYLLSAFLLIATPFCFAQEMDATEKKLAKLIDNKIISKNNKIKRILIHEEKFLLFKTHCHLELGHRPTVVKLGFIKENFLPIKVSVYGVFKGTLCNSIIDIDNQYIDITLEIVTPSNPTDECGTIFQVNTSNIKGLPGYFDKKLNKALKFDACSEWF